MEGEVVSMEAAVDGKVLPEGAEALLQATAVAQQAEVTGNMEMMVMDALDPTLLQMKTEVLEGGGTVTVTGGDEGQIITLQVVNMEEQAGAALGLGQLQLVQVPVSTTTVAGLQATYVEASELSIAEFNLAAAIIRVEDEVTGEVNDIIVKKEVGADQEDDIAEEVIVGEGKATIQMEELSQVEEAVQDPQLTEAPPNGDLTPEMILSMMDR